MGKYPIDSKANWITDYQKLVFRALLIAAVSASASLTGRLSDFGNTRETHVPHSSLEFAKYIFTDENSKWKETVPNESFAWYCRRWPCLHRHCRLQSWPKSGRQLWFFYWWQLNCQEASSSTVLRIGSLNCLASAIVFLCCALLQFGSSEYDLRDKLNSIRT